MSEMLSMLQGAIAGRSPIVYVYSPEEERIVRAIKSIAEPLNQPVTTWSCVSGLDGYGDETQDPASTAFIRDNIQGMIVPHLALS